MSCNIWSFTSFLTQSSYNPYKFLWVLAASSTLIRHFKWAPGWRLITRKTKSWLKVGMVSPNLCSVEREERLKMKLRLKMSTWGLFFYKIQRGEDLRISWWRTHPHQEGVASRLHWDRNSYARTLSRPQPVYLFIQLFTCILYQSLINW